MTFLKVTVAIAATIIVSFSTTSEARRSTHNPGDLSNQVPIYCGDRVCGHETVGKAKRSHKRMSMRTERGQEYVKPKRDTDRLVPREVHEAGSGVVRSKKTGATARVSPKYAGKFQGFIDDLESEGATIKFLGGYRKGKCWQGGKHPCGMALDYCQYGRGIVDRKCNLPGRARVAAIAKQHGLFEGGQWCNHDYGHVEAGGSSPCGKNLWSAVAKHKRMARLQ